MKKILVVLLTLATISVNAQTADEIIQKYAAHLGGLDAFNKIKTAKFTATFSTQGQDFPMTIQVINGKAARTDVDIMDQQVIRVYNNGKAWQQNPFAGITTPTEVTSATDLSDFKLQSMLTSPLMNYKALGNTVELLGQVDVDGVNTYKIKMTAKEDGRVTTYFISSKDYDIIKSESEREIQGQKTTVEAYYSNLKDFNGTRFYMTRTQKIGGEVFQESTFTNIELNVPVDESIFKM